ncbi:hypothetical protein N7449_008306 [Penicillium cf. viridicatum]|uniref:Uncharacterized protein n=1 Tax=Penicillium cf. viridicatum TaxID=2972119 RepID=A0A9W9J7W7_9EURO|nr:hypothetical protein N7449_008306 [Penicillium cf. viridicatum]
MDKSAIIGLTRALAREGAQHNILVSAIAPNAGTNMTKSILSDEDAKAMKPDHIAPMVSALASSAVPASASAGVYEVGSGWFGRTQWERKSVSFEGFSSAEEALTRIASLDSGQTSHPSSVEEHMKLLHTQRDETCSRTSEAMPRYSGLDSLRQGAARIPQSHPCRRQGLKCNHHARTFGGWWERHFEFL